MSDWHPEDIKAAVRKRGHTLAGLAAKLGITRQAMCQTLTRPAAANEALIASVINVDPSVIWPSRYDVRGIRRSPQPRRLYRSTTRFGKGGRGK